MVVQGIKVLKTKGVEKEIVKEDKNLRLTFKHCTFNYKRGLRKRNRCFRYVVVILIILLIFYLGWKTLTRRHNYNNKIIKSRNKRSVSDNNKKDAIIRTSRRTIHKNIVEHIQAESIRKFSQHYSGSSHIAGSIQNEKLAEEMADKWKHFGFDKTEIFRYKVLLSYPNQPAKILLRDGSQLRQEIIVDNERAFGPSERNGSIMSPYFAYSRSGNISAPVVYCNYGAIKDYEKLQKLNIVTKNKIFLLRNGGTDPRPDIIQNAIKRGALAILYYSDPADFLLNGDPYPNGEMLNEFGVERRNAGMKANIAGDVLSEGYPSKPYYHREKKSSVKKYLHEVPLQPISASAAKTIFKFMAGSFTHTEIPKTFRGNLNTTHVLQSGENKTMSLRVDNKLKDQTTSVVCGTLFGSIEPDRYVIIGNHRDSWVYGASDPVSGSAALSEIVKVLGTYKKETGYRARRSLMACSWGAEEMGILGSSEWSDENKKFITRNVIAYINVDTAVDGNFTVKLKASDQIAKSVMTAARLTPSADNENKNETLFEDMCKKEAKLKGKKKSLDNPTYSSPGLMSDNIQFSNTYGKAVSDYRYTFNQLDFPNLEHVGQYHTRYDSFDWMAKFIDPTFRYHQTLAKLWLTHVLILIDSDVIPFDLKQYVMKFKSNFNELGKEFSLNFHRYNISIKTVNKRLDLLQLAVDKFEKTLPRLDTEKLGFNRLRAINDVIANFGHQFILKSEVRFTNQIYNAQNVFSGIKTAISDKPGKNWNNVRRELTLLMWCIDSAIKSLNLTELRLST